MEGKKRITRAARSFVRLMCARDDRYDTYVYIYKCPSIREAIYCGGWLIYEGHDILRVGLRKIGRTGEGFIYIVAG